MATVIPGEPMSSFVAWLDTFVEEKGIDLDEHFDVEGPSGTNVFPMGVVIDTIKQTNADEQAAIKQQLVILDFQNRDVAAYFRHLAGALAL